MHNDPASWRITAAMPYDSAMSKNALYGRGRSGQVFIRTKSARRSSELEFILRLEMRRLDIKPANDLVHLLIDVDKDEMRSDAINVLDVVADAVKKAIGIDDRWFSAEVRWRIVRSKPMLRVTVSQTRYDLRHCSACMKTLSVENFPKDDRGPRGRAWFCATCVAAIEEDARAIRRAKARARKTKAAPGVKQ